MLEYGIVEFIFCTLDFSVSSSFHEGCVIFYVFQFKLETSELLGGGHRGSKMNELTWALWQNCYFYGFYSSTNKQCYLFKIYIYSSEEPLSR